MRQKVIAQSLCGGGFPRVQSEGQREKPLANLNRRIGRMPGFGLLIPFGGKNGRQYRGIALDQIRGNARRQDKLHECVERCCRGCGGAGTKPRQRRNQRAQRTCRSSHGAVRLCRRNQSRRRIGRGRYPHIGACQQHDGGRALPDDAATTPDFNPKIACRQAIFFCGMGYRHKFLMTASV